MKHTITVSKCCEAEAHRNHSKNPHDLPYICSKCTQLCFASEITLTPDSEIARDYVSKARVAEMLGLENAWCLKDVLLKLIEASEILLDEKNYDGHGYEEIGICIEKGKIYAKQLNITLDTE